MYRPIVKLNTNTCKVCKKVFKNEKSMKDHIFNNRIKDVSHMEYRNEIIKLRFAKAKLTCPVCEQKVFRCMRTHFKYQKDKTHESFIKSQGEFLLNNFLNQKSIMDISKINNIFTSQFSHKYMIKMLKEIIGKNRFNEQSKIIFSKKRKELWQGIPEENKKTIIEKVRNAEWGNLTNEERKNHPWVMAGRKASLESSKKGSKNQMHAFKLLKEKFPDKNWIYNHVIHNEWQIDIAAPEEKLFIEWDGRYHFVPIHGKNNLNNRINRDKIKNKILTKELNGCLIRIIDEGRENEKFVEEKINQISHIIKNNLQKGVLIQI